MYAKRRQKLVNRMLAKKNLKYDHSDKNCRVVLSCGTVYHAVLGGSNVDLYFPVVLASV